jgi:hypothetical protein
MARAILHNSNYQSVFGCKEAIDRYFAERNQAFLEHRGEQAIRSGARSGSKPYLERKTIARIRVGDNQRVN